jgi:glucokinase
LPEFPFSGLLLYYCDASKKDLFMEIAVGIDIGGTNTKIGLISSEGSLIGFESFPTTGPATFSEYTQKVKSTVDSLLHKNELSYEQILGIGVGAPNGNGKNGFVESPPNLKQWGTVDLVTPFKQAFNKPVKLENDANVAALGEGLWGVAKGMDDFIVVTLGTGVGTGVVVNNDLVRGVNGLAGEGGHIIIEENGRNCGCGGRGHLEIYASVKGIKMTTKEITGKDLQFREIAELYRQGDEEMEKVFKQTAHYLGKGISIMGSLFCPEAIVLAGGVATIGDHFRQQVEDVYNELVYAPFKNATKVLISSVSTGEGAVLGAASLIFKE